MENVKSQVAACPICGNNWLIAATKTTFSRRTSRDFAKLMEKGYVIKAVSLHEARTTEMYCEHKPPFSPIELPNVQEGDTTRR